MRNTLKRKLLGSLLAAAMTVSCFSALLAVPATAQAEEREATYFEGYEALFNIKDDGLYLSYIAVPEPAAFAVMLGALALGLCACRKRK